jgi:2'-5' RNA ligase
MSQIRAFLAVNLPIRQIDEVRQIQGQLRERAMEAGMKVAWVPSPNMHVTLKFLADIPEELVSAIRDLLGPVLEARRAVQLEVGGLGVFPGAGKPRVLWVGVESEGDALGELAGEIDDQLETLGFEKETREFHAHLTLGRVKHARGGLGELYTGLEQTAFGGCSVHEVVLYQSVLQRTGAEYKPLARFPLAARG